VEITKTGRETKDAPTKSNMVVSGLHNTQIKFTSLL